MARARRRTWFTRILELRMSLRSRHLPSFDMAPLEGLSAAHVILLGIHICASGDIADLPVLQAHYPHCFPLERLLRIILTFLPESTEPSQYAPVLQALIAKEQSVPRDREIDISAVKDLSESEARRRVQKLRLRPLKRDEEEEEVAASDLLTQFLIHRAHLIDSEIALQPLVLNLILPFYEDHPVLRTWLISSLLPALRLNYEYYPNREDTLSLDTLDLMDDQTAVNVLLSITGSKRNNMDLVTNLRGLVGPWLFGSKRSKRRKLNETAQQNTIFFIQGTPKPQATELAGWEYVNEWLLSRSLTDYDTIVSAFTNWDGPTDTDLGGYDKEGTGIISDKASELLNRYGQSGLSVIYAQADASNFVLDGSFQILSRVAKLLGLDEFSYLDFSEATLPSVGYNAELISSTSRASLLQNALMASENPLTYPSPSSVSFQSALLLSLRVLANLGHHIPCRVAANICLHSSEEMQVTELQSVMASTVRQPRSKQEWQVVREQLLWLRDWQTEYSDNGWDEPSTYHGLFWRISRKTVETEILKVLLGAKGKLHNYRSALPVTKY